MTAQFKVGDLVWAKLRYYPAWPAKVVDPPLGERKKNAYYVFFYGSDNYAWIKSTDVYSYEKNYFVQKDMRNSLYRKAVQKISEVYHEESLSQSDNDFNKTQKPKRTKEEGEERSRKIQERLKVRMFPKKGTKTKVNKNKTVKTEKKSSDIDEASGTSSSIPSSSSCIITVNCIDSAEDYEFQIILEAITGIRDYTEDCLNFSVVVRDYKKVILNEVVVLLQRCDEGLPSLTCDAAEPECSCQEDQPPALLPEL